MYARTRVKRGVGGWVGVQFVCAGSDNSNRGADNRSFPETDV